jgi:thiol:disulfide interchange protein DsbC
MKSLNSNLNWMLPRGLAVAFAVTVWAANPSFAQAASSSPEPSTAATPTASVPDAIRTALQQRFQRLPPIDGIEPSAVAGLWEVRMGNEVVYVDAKAEHLIKGDIIDTVSRRNLTQDRVTQLSVVDFASLPLQDAIVWKNGNGARKIAVFADPNCGYCKHFEQGLKDVKNITVYTFLYPILGGDSPQKAEAIWCAKDRADAWNGWMRDGKSPPKLLGPCQNPLERNLAFGQKHHINGTPGILFEDGTRIPGALSPQALEEQFKKIGKKS